MSTVPQRTQILVKNLPFQEKYHLSHIQTDLMAYLVNIISWAICVDGYYVITTSKIMSDLPKIGQKTIEASLKALKDLELIECKMVKVPQWQGNIKHRGVKLTSKGREYNGTLMLPTQDKKLRELEKKNKELEEEKKKLEKENRELKEIINNIDVSKSETSTPNNQEKPKPIVPTMPTKQAIEVFIDNVTKRFGRSSQPICNVVPKWDKKTTFYINSYNKLSIITPETDHKQLKDPMLIANFWQWLYANSSRIGDQIDFNKTPTIKELENRFLNQTITIGEKKNRVSGFVKVEGGVTIKLESLDGKVGSIIDSITRKEKVFGLRVCQEVLFDRLDT
jgi:DNA-binding HxlR family transcriptional regulator